MVLALMGYKILGNLLSLSIGFMTYKMGVLILAPPTLEAKTDVLMPNLNLRESKLLPCRCYNLPPRCPVPECQTWNKVC